MHFCSFFAEDVWASEKNPKVFIDRAILLLRLLRNFGHMIVNLGINFKMLNEKTCAEVKHYLAEYCSDSLQRFSVECCKRLYFEDLQRPFKNVKALNVLAKEKDDFLILNEDNFPNLQHLLIHDTYFKE